MNKKIVALNEIDRYLLGEGYSDHQELVMTSEMISKPGLVNTEIYRFLINTPEAERAERIDELIVIMETPTELVEFRCGIARALVCVETEDEKLKERIVDALIRCVQAKESSGLIKCIFEDVFEEFLFSSVTTYSSDDVPVFQIDKKCRCEILNAVISFANNNLTSEEGKVATNLLSYAAMDREREGELVSLLIKLIQDQEAWEIDDADNLIGMARQMSDLAVVELSEVVFRDLYSQSSSSAKKRYSAYVLFHIGNKEIIQKLTNTLNQYLNQKSQNAKVVFETVMSLVRKMRTSKEDDLSSVVFEALEGEDCLFLEEFELEGIIKSLIDALLINAAYPDECVGDVVFQLKEMARGGEPLKTFIIDGLIEFFKENNTHPIKNKVELTEFERWYLTK
mgnify:CR=1 FL=1